MGSVYPAPQWLGTWPFSLRGAIASVRSPPSSASNSLLSGSIATQTYWGARSRRSMASAASGVSCFIRNLKKHLTTVLESVYAFLVSYISICSSTGPSRSPTGWGLPFHGGFSAVSHTPRKFASLLGLFEYLWGSHDTRKVRRCALPVTIPDGHPAG